MSRQTSTRPILHSTILSAGITLALFMLSILPITAQQGHSPWSPDSATPASEAVLDDWIAAAIRPELQGTIAEIMPANLPVYDISVTLEPQAERGAVPSLTGHLLLTWTNQTDETIDALPFRLFANGPAADHDAQIVSDVRVNGIAVDAGLSVLDSVLTVPFEEPLAPGDVAEVSMDFAAFLPINSTDHYGIFGYETESGTWALAHWYPVVAGWDPTSGFLLDPPSENGDPIFTDTALYDVRITTEQGWRVVTTGVEFGDVDTVVDDGTTTRRFVSGPARDFTIVADADFEVATTEVDGIIVNSWFNPGQERVGHAIADYAAQSVSLFSELLWPYPFVELDLVPVNMSGAAGCEFSQLIYMGSDYYTDSENLSVPNSLDFTVAHEVVHQWFYGLVGNNQYAHAFIDEGVTNYLSAQVYFEMTYGPDAAAAIVDRHIVRSYDATVNGGGDVVVDQPTDDFPDGYDYVFAAYSKAPLGFAAIREAIGDDAFFGALAAYVDQFVFLVAEPDQLLDAFEQASGQDLTELWHEWFEEAAELPAP